MDNFSLFLFSYRKSPKCRLPGELWFLTWLCAGFRRRCRTATTVYGGEGLGAAVGARWRPLVAAAVAVAPPPSAQPPDCGPGRAGGRGRWRRCTRRSAVVIDELKSLKHMFSVWKCSKKGFLCLSIFFREFSLRQDISCPTSVLSMICLVPMVYLSEGLSCLWFVQLQIFEILLKNVMAGISKIVLFNDFPDFPTWSSPRIGTTPCSACVGTK